MYIIWATLNIYTCIYESNQNMILFVPVFEDKSNGKMQNNGIIIIRLILSVTVNTLST